MIAGDGSKNEIGPWKGGLGVKLKISIFGEKFPITCRSPAVIVRERMQEKRLGLKLGHEIGGWDLIYDMLPFMVIDYHFWTRPIFWNCIGNE